MMLRVSAVLLFSISTAASAQFISINGPTPDLRTEWRIEPAAAPTGVRDFASKEFVLKQRLLPSGLIELGRMVTQPEAGSELPAGTQLIEVQSPMGVVFCEGEAHTGGLAGAKQVCLIDADWDNRFESSFRFPNRTSAALVMVDGRMPKKRFPLAAPIPYERIDPARSRFDAFVAIERRNFFNIYGKENFQIVFGTGSKQERITSPIGFTSAEMPKELTILGARFTALGEKDGKMSIRVDEAMAAQPFAVMKTVSYR